jgi:hypothetical protein
MLIAVSLRAFASGKTLPQNEPREVKRETRIPAPRQARACLEMQHADDYFRQTNSDRLLAGRPDANFPALLTKDVQGG